LLFAGAADEVSGRPRSLFSNRRVLTDQRFVDPDKLDDIEVSLSFRGRDLSHAVFNNADLRKADFTGAMLNGASFFSAELQNAKFDCGETGVKTETPRWPDDGCTWLQGASFPLAGLRGASFSEARLQGATLLNALSQDASFWYARLQGATLEFARLQGAKLVGAQLQGASLFSAKLQGASLEAAELQGASLERAQLQGALLSEAKLQGAVLDKARLQGASLRNTSVWRARGAPEIDLADLNGVDAGTKPWEQGRGTRSTFSVWRDDILKAIADGNRDGARERLSALDPTPENEPNNSIDAEFWKKASASQSKERSRRVVAFLTELACSSDGAPYVWRGLRHNSRAEATESQIAAVAASLRKAKSDQGACSGVKDFTDEDWADLDELVAATRKLAPNEKRK